MSKRLVLTFMSFLIICLTLVPAEAQQTGFTYQGKLTDSGTPANGNYDLQFALFDQPTGGTQIGLTQNFANVSVTGGVFTVTLDFGPGIFDGGSRFLEISPRATGTGSFTVLTPRQRITSTPYAVRSLTTATADAATNAQNLGGVAANQYVQGNDARLSDARAPAAGSSNYIQNNSRLQAAANFNISGDGTASGTLSGNVVSATSRFNLGGFPILRISGASNDSLGVGRFTGGDGEGNTFVGYEAGSAGFPDAQNNTFVGKNAGVFPIFHGSGNTLLGADSKLGSSFNSLSNATAIGAGALVDQSNSLVLGDGVKVGIGTTAPQFKLHVVDPSNTGLRVQTNVGGGTVASFGGFGEFQIDAPGNPAGRLNVKENGSVVLGDCPGCFPNVTDRLVVSGTARILSLGSGGSTSLCRNGSGQISACSSSIRYKTNIADWRGGLSLVNRLRPVTFDWKENKAHDLGLVAEEVAAAEPLLVTRNEKGEIEGVKYDRLSAVFINAFKEQQVQIEQQQEEAKSQQNEIALLRTANYSLNARLRNIEKALQRHPAIRRRPLTPR